MRFSQSSLSIAKLSSEMKYFLALFVFGILCQNTLARGLDDPVLNDFERRLVRLEERQFSESENLEHRMLLLETHLGKQNEDKTLEGSNYKISRVEKPADGLTFLQRLEKVETNWNYKLFEHLRELEAKHGNLDEKLSAIERKVKEAQRSSSLSEQKMEETDQREFVLVVDKTNPENGESEAELGSGYAESEFEDKEILRGFDKIGSNYYFVEKNEHNRKTWWAARDYCKQLNAHLVSLRNEEEWVLLSHMGLDSRADYWTDINDRSTEGEFVSESTGKTDPYLKWNEGEPSSSPGDEDCVELSSNGGHKMNDADCSSEIFYVCELDKKSLK